MLISQKKIEGVLFRQTLTFWKVLKNIYEGEIKCLVTLTFWLTSVDTRNFTVSVIKVAARYPTLVCPICTFINFEKKFGIKSSKLKTGYKSEFVINNSKDMSK